MKVNDNFLRGFCRQLREALDEGRELAYEFGELCDEALELVTPTQDPDDGDPGDQMELSDSGGSPDSGTLHRGDVDGEEQSDLPITSRMVRGDGHVPNGHDSAGGVPRGTRVRSGEALTEPPRKKVGYTHGED